MSKINISYYKVKESFKENFEKILKRVHFLKKAEILKKKRGKYYTYYVKSNPLFDYFLIIPPKKQVSHPKIDKKTYKKYKSYREALDKLILFKDQNPLTNGGIKVTGKNTKKLKDFKRILDVHPRVLKYFYNKHINCLTACINHPYGVFILDIYPDKIVEGLVLNFDLFQGFYHGKPYVNQVIDNFVKSLNTFFYNWVERNFTGYVLES